MTLRNDSDQQLWPAGLRGAVVCGLSDDRRGRVEATCVIAPADKLQARQLTMIE